MGLEDEIRQQGNWYHNIEIDGVETKPSTGEDPHQIEKFKELKKYLPANLTGTSVLDIGCNAGMECFYCEKLGANKIVGVEISPYYIKQARWARERLNSDVRFIQENIEAFQTGLKFDYILCLAFIYHVENPILVMKKIRNWLKPNGVLIIEIQYIIPEKSKNKRLLSFRPYKAAMFMSSREAMEDILDYTGFEIIKSKEIVSRRKMYYCKKK